jgi:hypothetical protein
MQDSGEGVTVGAEGLELHAFVVEALEPHLNNRNDREPR